MNDASSGFRSAATSRRVWLGFATAAALLGLGTQWRRIAGLVSPTPPLDIHAHPRHLADLTFSDAQGEPTTLAAFRGRVVLLNIWATWCVPCREEMPTLDRLQALLGGPDFEVVALSIDHGGLSEVQPFFERAGIRHLHPYLDTAGTAMSDLAVTVVPLTLLVDRDGREVARKLGPATWNEPAMVRVLRERIDDSGRAR